MKKIVYIGNNLKRGNPTTLVQLATLLRECAFEVICFSSKENKIARLIDMFTGVLKHTKADYVLIDTYSTSNFYYALLISQICRVFKLKYIPILHGGNLPKRLKNNPTLSKLIFAHSYINISPSNYLVYEFQQSNFKTDFIPNALNLTEYKFKERECLAYKLLWVRAFDEIYNPKMAIEVVNILKDKGLKVSLCMVGPDKDGSLEQTKSLAKKYKLLDCIEFKGYLSKQEWLKKSEEFDVFINTTNIDNIPVSVIEAMALGLPVVSTNVGGIPYLIKHNKTGKLVGKENALEMSQAIIELVENLESTLNIIKNARLYVETFDTQKIKKMWVKLLN